MAAADPHIHVDVKFGGDAAMRGVLASTFGLAADVPATVTTGCGERVAFAMTSTQPERVTCLACRGFAHRQHLHLADQLERLGLMAGSAITPDQVEAAASLHRDFAGRFAE